MINAGGIINVSTEYLKDGDQETVRARIEADPGRLEAIWEESARHRPNPARRRRRRWPQTSLIGRGLRRRFRARAAPSRRSFAAELVLAIEGVEAAATIIAAPAQVLAGGMGVPEQPAEQHRPDQLGIIERHHHRDRREAQRRGQEQLADAAGAGRAPSRIAQVRASCACAVKGHEQAGRRASRSR